MSVHLFKRGFCLAGGCLLRGDLLISCLFKGSFWISYLLLGNKTVAADVVSNVTYVGTDNVEALVTPPSLNSELLNVEPKDPFQPSFFLSEGFKSKGFESKKFENEELLLADSVQQKTEANSTQSIATAAQAVEHNLLKSAIDKSVEQKARLNCHQITTEKLDYTVGEQERTQRLKGVMISQGKKIALVQMGDGTIEPVTIGQSVTVSDDLVTDISIDGFTLRSNLVAVDCDNLSAVNANFSK